MAHNNNDLSQKLLVIFKNIDAVKSEYHEKAINRIATNQFNEIGHFLSDLCASIDFHENCLSDEEQLLCDQMKHENYNFNSDISHSLAHTLSQTSWNSLKMKQRILEEQLKCKKLILDDAYKVIEINQNVSDELKKDMVQLQYEQTNFDSHNKACEEIYNTAVNNIMLSTHNLMKKIDNWQDVIQKKKYEYGSPLQTELMELLNRTENVIPLFQKIMQGAWEAIKGPTNYTKLEESYFKEFQEKLTHALHTKIFLELKLHTRLKAVSNNIDHHSLENKCKQIIDIQIQKLVQKIISNTLHPVHNVYLINEKQCLEQLITNFEMFNMHRAQFEILFCHIHEQEKSLDDDVVLLNNYNKFLQESLEAKKMLILHIKSVTKEFAEKITLPISKHYIDIQSVNAIVNFDLDEPTISTFHSKRMNALESLVWSKMNCFNKACNDLEKHVNILKEVTYSKNMSKPALTTPIFMRLIMDVKQLENSSQSQLRDITKQFSKHKEQLKTNKWLNVKRLLWVYYLTNPKQLPKFLKSMQKEHIENESKKMFKLCT